VTTRATELGFSSSMARASPQMSGGSGVKSTTSLSVDTSGGRNRA
jgi:hypothetical protein